MVPFQQAAMLQSASAIDDQQLLHAFTTAGDEAALRQIVDRHARWIFAAALRQLRGDHHLAEDAVQVVFIVLARRASSMNPRRHKLSGWLFNTLQFTVKNLRRSQRTRLKYESEAALPEVQPEELSPVEVQECAERLDAAVMKLSPADRTAIVLRFHQELPFAQVAHALGTTEDAARKRVERALIVLRRRLGPTATTSLLSASAAFGLERTPPALAHTVAHTVLASKASAAALPPAIAVAAKGVTSLMAAAKAQAVAAVAAVCILIAVPASVVTWRTIHPTSPPPHIQLASAPSGSVAIPIIDPAPAPAAATNAITVGGVVHDEAGKPIAGVSVRLDWLEPNPGRPPAKDGSPSRSRRRATVRTDADGRFQYSPVRTDDPSTIHVALQQKDFVSEPGATAKSGQVFDQTAEFVLVRGVVINGAVLNQNGEPIAGAKVTTNGSRYSTDKTRDTTTDAQGHFTLPPTKPETTALTVTAKGHGPELQRVDVAEGMPAVNVTLPPPLTIRGHVLDPDGKPVANADVSVRRWRNADSLAWQGHTDSEGRFAMPDAPADSVEFEISKAGYQSLIGDRDASLSAGDGEKTFTMHPQPVARGQVVDADTGEPIAKFNVIVGWVFWKGHPPFWMFDKAKPFTDGNYQLTMDGHSEVLAYHIRVEADGYTPAVTEGFQTSGTFDMALHKGADVRGRVIDPDGKPVAGAQVILALPGAQVDLLDARLERASEERLFQSDASGEFHFSPEPGKFHLLALSDASGSALSVFDHQPDGPIELKLEPWATVIGRYPAPPAAKNATSIQTWFYAIQPEREQDVRYQWNYMLTADETGQFTVRKAPSFGGKPVQLGVGRFTENGSDGRRWIPMRLTAGQTMQTDMSGATIVGRIVPADGKPSHLPGRIMLTPLMPPPARDWPVDWSQSAQLPPPLYLIDFHGAGSFRFDGVRAGKYMYEASLQTETQQDLRAVGTIDVPPVEDMDVAGSGSDRVDMGDIKCLPQVTVKAGDAAPAVLGNTLADAPIRLEEFANKVLVIALWDHDGGLSDAAMPELAKLGQQYATDGHVALMALNLDAINNMNGIVHRPGELKMAGWRDGYVPQTGGLLTAGLRWEERPAIFVVGRDGKILARDVDVKDIAEVLRKAVAAGP
jgi:RNA polymerase sigma factor (sigma-70 family)